MPSIIISNADASASLDYYLPFPGIQYLGFFGSGMDLSRNLGLGSAVSVVGAPAQSAGFASFDKENYIGTAEPDVPELTLICAGRAPTGRAIYVTNFWGSAENAAGAGLYRWDSQTRGTAEVKEAGVFAHRQARVDDDNAEWGFRVTRITATHVEVRNLTTGAGADVALDGVRAPTATPFRIGQTNSSIFMEGSDQIMACIVNRAATDVEIAELYGLTQARAAANGIII